ncbi:hypothetical protein IF2G_06880 [Cordyceps javanica]|nr:hypothetical protein IF2G_06880 [Cordyceps javanica]
MPLKSPHRILPLTTQTRDAFLYRRTDRPLLTPKPVVSLPSATLAAPYSHSHSRSHSHPHFLTKSTTKYGVPIITTAGKPQSAAPMPRIHGTYGVQVPRLPTLPSLVRSEQAAYMLPFPVPTSLWTVYGGLPFWDIKVPPPSIIRDLASIPSSSHPKF